MKFTTYISGSMNIIPVGHCDGSNKFYAYNYGSIVQQVVPLSCTREYLISVVLSDGNYDSSIMGKVCYGFANLLRRLPNLPRPRREHEVPRVPKKVQIQNRAITNPGT